MSEQDKAYVGFAPCGCAVAAMVAGYDTERGEKAELKRWTKQGYKIKVMKVKTARKQQGFLGCIHRNENHRSTGEDALDALVERARSS